MASLKLSAVVIAFNEERNIVRCIHSLRRVADEVVVVDSYSTDKTRELAIALGARVVEHPFRGFTEQKNFAVAQAQYDLILSLDADEYLSETLVTSILEVKERGDADGYTFNRLNYFKGRPIKSCGWYPDAKIRLWNRQKGRWVGDLLHEIVTLDKGAAQKHLAGDLLHDAYRSVSELVGKVQKYSDIYAQQHAFRKKVSSFKILYKTAAAFFKNYILQRGIFDGYAGLVIAASNANGVFYKYAKLQEINRMFTVSLIVTTYNRADALRQVLLSVLHQSVLPLEVLVADDGSRNDTKELVESLAITYPVPLRHVWHEDTGFRLAMIRNRAIAQAKGDYIINIDGDILLPRHFIKDHQRNAMKGRFLQGSRVLLSEELTKKALTENIRTFSFFQSGITNRMNTVHSTLLSKLFSYYNTNIYRVRGANLSFWREDLAKVNGFNEDFEGWGREDSEFVARMLNAGIKKYHLKFAGFGYHLYHHESSREMLPKNQQILDTTVQNKLARCINGLDKYTAR